MTRVAIPLLAALLAGGPVSGAARVPAPPGDQVFLTREEAFREIFPDASRVVAETWSLASFDAQRIEGRADAEVPSLEPVTYRVLSASGERLGYAMVLEERGKYRPITFMVGVGLDLRVRGVEVMVYREDRGGEVRHQRFLRQYRGKKAGDPVRRHRDIVNITGATISVQSLNRGVRRALATLELLYGPGGQRSPAATRTLSLGAADEG